MADNERSKPSPQDKFGSIENLVKEGNNPMVQIRLQYPLAEGVILNKRLGPEPGVKLPDPIVYLNPDQLLRFKGKKSK